MVVFRGRVPPWHGAGQLLRGVLLVQSGVEPERIASAVKEELGWLGDRHYHLCRLTVDVSNPWAKLKLTLECRVKKSRAFGV